MREKLNMSFWRQQLRKEISLAQVIPERGLRPTPDPASDATSQDTEKRHAQSHSPPKKHAQPVASGDTGRWTVPRDALAPLGRSSPPRPGEWNVHRDALAPLGKPPLLPRTLAQPYKSGSNDGAQFQSPGPCPKHELRT